MSAIHASLSMWVWTSMTVMRFLWVYDGVAASLAGRAKIRSDRLACQSKCSIDSLAKSSSIRGGENLGGGGSAGNPTEGRRHEREHFDQRAGSEGARQCNAAARARRYQSDIARRAQAGERSPWRPPT